MVAHTMMAHTTVAGVRDTETARQQGFAHFRGGWALLDAKSGQCKKDGEEVIPEDVPQVARVVRVKKYKCGIGGGENALGENRG